MSIRKEPFVPGEFYHCYNRGVDKRIVFQDPQDFSYFLKILELFNDVDVSLSIRERKENVAINNRYVTIVAYCLNRNHYHLLLKEEIEGGISKFMQKIGTGYTMYFNQKQERTGSLFQGKFKSKHVDTDLYLKHLGVYINVNNEVHGFNEVADFRSSLKNFLEHKADAVCNPNFLLDLYDGFVDYHKEINTTLPLILRDKKEYPEISNEIYFE